MKQQTSLVKKAICLVAAVLMFASQAFATGPTPLTTIVLFKNGDINNPIVGGSLLVTFTACDNVNGNSFVATGAEVLLVQNTGGSSGTFTVTSVADALNRLDTSLTAYSVAASGFAAVQMKNLSGWQQTGSINLTCSAATMKFAVLQTK
jgi:hypothetical protein